jgi:hypothetical protein
LSAFAAASALDLGLLAASQRGVLPFDWSWLVALGCAGAYALSWALTGPAAERA